MTAEEPKVTTTKELRDILGRVTFVNTVLDFKWAFEVLPTTIYDVSKGRDAWLVWVTFERPDTLTGKVGRGRGRDEIIWAGATVSATVKTAWVLVKMIVEHELMEGFRFDDQRIFNPHNSVLDLADLQRAHEEKLK